MEIHPTYASTTFIHEPRGSSPVIVSSSFKRSDTTKQLAMVRTAMTARPSVTDPCHLMATSQTAVQSQMMRCMCHLNLFVTQATQMEWSENVMAIVSPTDVLANEPPILQTSG